MSAANDCGCNCENPTVTLVPGSPGDPGAAGLDARTVTTNAFVVPNQGAFAILQVDDSSWAAPEMVIFVGGDTATAGYFEVQNIGVGTITAEYMEIEQNTHQTDVIPAGALVVPAGPPFLPSGLPAIIVDTGPGTPSNDIAAGVGIQTLAFFISATAIADGDLITNYVPGYKFKLVKFDARAAAPITTGAKASTLNLEIGTTDVTGGVISLSGTYIQGAAQAGTAITAANTGTAASSFSIEASATTAFMEGAFWLLVSIQNMDTADAFATDSDKINDLIGAVTP